MCVHTCECVLAPCQIYGVQIFLSSHRLPIHSADCFLCYTKGKCFSLMESCQFIFPFVDCVLGIKYII